MIVLIDNYDSFTFNLYQYISEFHEVEVYRNDDITPEEILKLQPNGIVISPGAGTPKDAGISIDVVKRLGHRIPILGVCLGHQVIAEAYGGKVVRAREVFHGKSSKIKVKGDDIFAGVSRKIDVMRYHSLIVERVSLPEELEIIGETIENGDIMALKHKTNLVFGVQFHPESIYTLHGKKIIRNFVEGICNEYK
ncbi:anthranilate synthase component II [Inconstantimicrobium mannanitabidum]|uniref:Aminodeoxychorismate/anthranilate synthase component II n=1 Tax=Inconstantimicrobium mannanitabidum TaxID=1604901 RepID=A0ACB5RE56_9CLOT|nr:aminodeoxychorismate/anthranilate synthase component II [Clostridium sp. TW13]GKX67318.1 aminodeoxychorismate/anthranilate synthase component II [Clostridium sp. TW13]